MPTRRTTPRAGPDATRVEEATERSRAIQLKARFDAIPKVGMQAIRARDYDTLGTAIAEEKNIIEEQARLIAEQRRRSDARARSIVTTVRKLQAKTATRTTKAAKTAEARRR